MNANTKNSSEILMGFLSECEKTANEAQQRIANCEREQDTLRGAEPRPAGVPGGLADAGPKPVRRDGNPLVEPGRENCGDERPNRRRELGQRRSRAAFARLYSQHASAVHNFAAAFRALSPLRTSAPRSGFVGESDQEMEVML